MLALNFQSLAEHLSRKQKLGRVLEKNPIKDVAVKSHIRSKTTQSCDDIASTDTVSIITKGVWSVTIK